MIALIVACHDAAFVELSKNPDLANEVTAIFRDIGSDAVVTCEGETTADDPWPERHRFPVDASGSVTRFR